MIESEHGHDGIHTPAGGTDYWTDSGTYLGSPGHSMVVKNIGPWIEYTETAPLTEKQYKLLLKRAKQCSVHFTRHVHGSWIEPKNVCMFNKEV